jgi:hypothetical protein
MYHRIIQRIIEPNMPLFSTKTEDILKAWLLIHKNHSGITVPAFQYYIYILSFPHLNKFTFLMNNLRNRRFTLRQRAEILDIFCRTQRIYHTLVRFVKLCKIKRTPIYNTIDLLMNPIDRHTKSIIEIYQGNRVYLFTIYDVVNLVNANLSHSPFFFSDPLPVKNPYTNIPFTKSDLYNLYYFVKYSDHDMPLLMQLFFESNLDISRFKRDNAFIIRDLYIKTHVATMPSHLLLENIRNMFRDYTKIQIHAEFPNDRLIRIMRPYLVLYFQWAYSMSSVIQKRSMDQLLNKLSRFCHFNPRFGRKIMKLEKVFELSGKYKKWKKIVYFDDRHIPFRTLDDDFMQNHSRYVDNADDDSLSEYRSDNDDTSESDEYDDDDSVIYEDV